MINNDNIQRFIFENANVRGEMVRLKTTYQTIISQHAYPEPVKHLLGQVLAIASLLTATIKFNGRLTVQFQGRDPLKLLIAQSNHEFCLRGLVQSQAGVTESELLDALKEGVLTITISPDTTTQPYQGIVAWQGDTLAQSIEGYFENSEQLPTRLWLAINAECVTGMLLQALPKDERIQESDWEHIIHLTETITEDELLNLDNQTILHRLYSQEEVRVFEPAPVIFKCTCSLARSENAVLMLGREEAFQELEEKQSIVVTCEFCNTEYVFDREEVTTLFKDIQ